ncbi:e06617e5-c68b-4f76-b925-95c1916d8ae8 [Sclerotinia trifoliorum]|uniref:Conserved oligomeric Golgi complex subunit 1 n=1 Tax=Sclerotinia trifoliorum TaxID=28548 RepID=A0A8H2W1Q9_9HELO|nr:e06617e5-c68b-4f76-b925-95c1916d8ae8 [Sclerotinia trifoliorum]
MASTTLSTTTCFTSSEAFKHPLPQIRQFHRDLTTELDEKNARLRTLVGGSYRQLLGTAEQILQMRKDIREVEEKLGKVGEGCGRNVLVGMVSGLGKLQGEMKNGRKGEEMRGLARVKGLGMCGIVVGKLLRRQGRGKSLVVAAKVLVLSRLLAKSLEGCVDSVDREFVEEAKKKRVVLTKRLLRAVEKTLVSTKDGEDREDLVQALCAYSLATSSGAKDVLRHFLNVRGEAMALSFEDEEESDQETSGVMRALEIYTRTLLDVQELVPKRLSEALAALKTKPLLKDESIRDLEGLRLDVCERWFGDEILYFTPYVRHDDLEGSLAVDTLRGWAKKASEVLLEGFTKTLQGGLDFKVVVELRTKILEVWIRDGGKARGFDPSILRDGLRGVVNKRLVELLETRVGKLHLVGTEIESTLATWDKGITDHHASLWDEDMMATELSNGGNIFKQDIIARTFGRNDTVSRVVNSFQTWRHLIEEIGTVIDELKKQRWDDDLEDIEDDESLDSRQNLLTFQELHTKITTFVEQYKDSEHSGKISMYILRILRDIRAELPSNPSLQKFGLSLVQSLHESLASTVSEKSISSLAKSLEKKKVAGRALWEGTPELPVQPSPATFKFLRGLSTSMADAGADLWSPVAIKTLKVHLDSQVKEKWSKVLQEKTASNEITASSIDTSDAQNSAETEESEKEVHSKVDGELDEENKRSIETIFIRYFVLQQALASQSKQSGDMEKGITGMKLKDLSEEIEVKIKLEMQERKRVGSAAKEYWKRTGFVWILV